VKRTGIKRTKGVNPVNRKRAKKRKLEQFGPPGFADFVREYGCVVGREGSSLMTCMGPVQVAHLRSRGAGGGWRENCVGLCAGHHGVQHSLGVVTFAKQYAIDLDLWAAAVTHQWDLNEGKE
jgi:hypothetical protein